MDGNVYLLLDTEYRLGTRASGISLAERVKTKDCISSRKLFFFGGKTFLFLGDAEGKDYALKYVYR